MNPSNLNPYMILGLLPGATEKQIKRAYRRLAMKFHPDKNPNDLQMKKKFVMIHSAYETLCKCKESRPAPFDGGSQTHFSVELANPFFNFFMKLRSYCANRKKNT